jgi:cell division protein FtsW
MTNATFPAQAVTPRARTQAAPLRFDMWLIGAAMTLLCFGLVMSVSTSVSIAEHRELAAMHYFWRQLAAALVGLVGAGVILCIPLAKLGMLSTPMLFIAIALLVAVLVPGMGHEVNGSMRWLTLGPVSLQASEPTKLAIVIYLAAYMVRHHQQVRSDFVGFIKPIGVLTVVASLLLVEPDFGAAVVLFAAGLGMLFLAGVPLLRFTMWGLTALIALASLSMLAPYRVQRLMTFVDPWSDPFNSGFQLTQALIAFGRGEWFGVGLGNSVQKLFYLPEVHTDFVFAVVGEEIGMLGTIGVIILFVFLVWRIFYLGGVAERAQHLFAAYVTYGVGLLVGIQAFVNIGVNLGLLPTKGLPLPFLSYASNNLVVMCAAIALVLRGAYESRLPPGHVERDGGARE